jgi:endogenous inhibitor of DNA gyrase (YacG/DUF329 family)
MLTARTAPAYDPDEMPSEPEGMTVRDASPAFVSPPNQRPDPRRVRCPTCGASAPWVGNTERPFCSRTCRLVDLGVWLDEGYVVAGETDADVQ